MKNPCLENRLPASNPARRGSRSFTAKAGSMFVAALSLWGGVASAGLVLEVKPADYDAANLKWPIASGSILAGGGAGSDYFACAPWAPVSVTTKVASDGLSYKAVDFTAAGSILGGPLCPASLGGANPKTIEAWVYQPSNANGDAQTIIDLSRQGGPDHTNFAFCNSLYNRSIWAPPYVEGWNASNAIRSGKWAHLVASYDGATVNLYVNGAPDKAGISHTFATEAGGSISIGMMRFKGDGPNTTPHSTDNADGWNAYRGYLGAIRVYDEARTASQVSTDYALGVNYGEVGAGLPKVTSSVSGAGGTISPSGITYVASGSSQTFTFSPNLGYEVSDIVVDGDNTVPLATSYTFSNVTSDHTIAVSFAELPKQTASGKVTNGTTGIAGATVYFKTSANASAFPTFTTTTNSSGDYSQILPPGNWFVTASEIHYFTPSDATFTVASSAVAVADIVLTEDPNWDVLFSLNADALSGVADGARITSWACNIPVGTSMPASETWNNGDPMLGPVAQAFDGVKWEKNVRAVYRDNPPPTIHTRQDGFQLGGDYLAPIPVSGASVVTVVKPERKAISDPWTSIVDVFYNKLVLGIRNDSGNLIVWRNGTLVNGPSIPDGQKTILSLVVQPTGQFKVYANGLEVMSNSSPSDMSALVPGGAGHEKRIRVGRGWDDWTVFNGNIADTSLFKVALSEARRTSLEATLGTKFGITLPVYHNITATAGAGGTITPSGSVPVLSGADQEFTITPDVGFSILDVKVDGESLGAAESYTFYGVTGTHTIAASFTSVPQYAVSGTVTDRSTGLPISGATVYFSGAPNASLNSYTTATTDATGGYTKTLFGGPLFISASKTGYYNTADSSLEITGITTGIDIALATSVRNTPVPDQLLFSVLTEALPNSGPTGNWPTSMPVGGSLTQLNNPTVAVIDNQRWESNIMGSFQGYSVGTATSPIACTGASIVVTVRPDRSSGDSDNWKSIISYFHTSFGLAVQNGNGQVGVWRNGDLTWATATLPNRQKTVLSLVVQPTGEYALYANGQQIVINTTPSDMTSIRPGPAAHEQAIFVGRGWDGWNCYNGNIGDVFVYKTALTTEQRKQLESDSAAKFGITLPVLHTITASAGAGGTINPSGNVEVIQGLDQTFIITPNFGYSVGSVTVDGTPEAEPSTSYTFTNVTGPHNIAVTFVQNDNYGIWAAFYFPGGGADAAKDANPDGDSQNNLAEFAFDGDPTNPAISGKIRSQLADDNGQRALILTLPVLDGGVFTGATSLTATISGVKYTIEGSNDLSDANQVVTELATAHDAGLPALNVGWTYRSFRLEGAVPTRGATGFLRVRTEAPTP
jgi:hypothetical protein